MNKDIYAAMLLNKLLLDAYDMTSLNKEIDSSINEAEERVKSLKAKVKEQRLFR